jgi:hypothetical protein
MKNSIDYNDIFDIMIKQAELSLKNINENFTPWSFDEFNNIQGQLKVLKVLSEISQGDIHEHHAVIADQLLKVRRVVAKM